MDIFRKNPIEDSVSVRSIVSVWRFEISGGGEPIGDLHDFYELLYVEEGVYRIEVDGALFEVGEGEFLLHPPLAFHIGARDRRERCVIRIISFESDSEELKQIAKRPIKASAAARELFIRANEIGQRIFFFPGSEDGIRGMATVSGASKYSFQRMKKYLELSLVEIISQADEAVGEAQNSKNFKKERALALSELLRLNVSRSLTLGEMAEAMAVSVSTLKVISAEAFGMPPLAYFVSLKLSMAKRMIKESSLSFTEISERLGFGSVHYFSRIFKSHVGMTPTEYARSIDL